MNTGKAYGKNLYKLQKFQIQAPKKLQKAAKIYTSHKNLYKLQLRLSSNEKLVKTNQTLI